LNSFPVISPLRFSFIAFSAISSIYISDIRFSWTADGEGRSLSAPLLRRPTANPKLESPGTAQGAPKKKKEKSDAPTYLPFF
jgi:hypothetical protein